MRTKRPSLSHAARWSRSMVRRTLPESSRRPDADDFETFRMLGAADPISQEVSQVSGDGLRMGCVVEFEDAVDALSEFGIWQADAGAQIRMGRYRPSTSAG